MTLSAIKVTQPLGEFYITKMTARQLLTISESRQYHYNSDGSQSGSQRAIDGKRLSAISDFIKSEEMCFPTSILIALNSDEYYIENEDHGVVKITEINDVLCKIEISDDRKIAQVIDGQHRLKAFELVPEKQDVELVCSIFINLPDPYQAYLFATINGNQVKVDKSLAYEFFGYNVENEPSGQWTPEKLAVYLTRKLNFRGDSPLYHKLKLAADYDGQGRNGKLASTAAMVGGILSLISSKPQEDRNKIYRKKNTLFQKRSRELVRDRTDSSPLRSYYLENRDDEIYSIVESFFGSVNENLWEHAKSGSTILKTIGIFAMFDFLKSILQHSSKNEIDFKNIEYKKYVSKISDIDFSDNFFPAAPLGRGRIKRIAQYLSGITSIESLKDADIKYLLVNSIGDIDRLERYLNQKNKDK